MTPLRAKDIRGTWGTLITPWNADGGLDYGRLGEEVDRLIGSGVAGIYSNGTAGEFHCQEEDEFDLISALLAEKCTAAGMPFQIGVSHMSAQISLSRLRRVVPLSPGAVQVILPDWFPVTGDEAYSFLDRMAEAACGIGLVLYNPPHAKRVLRPAEVGILARRIPALIGLKTAGGDDAWYEELRAHLSGLSVFIPGHMLASGIRKGAQGSYSNVACLNPTAAAAWNRSIHEDPQAGLEMEGRIRAFMEEHIAPYIRVHGYCNAACDRFLALVGGSRDVGIAMRWPYRSIPETHVEGVRDAARSVLPEFFQDV